MIFLPVVLAVGIIIGIVVGVLLGIGVGWIAGTVLTLISNEARIDLGIAVLVFIALSYLAYRVLQTPKTHTIK
ncbi:hypothetical protein LSG31_19360 [Fodinisporobacter ferrooxydans]|uniref:GlsB/YeaQ/YmgE family stress response membrane protein n=1 Tax=Fodinisporobacter ferrooxydans TaxID=2901836 RepID=A0ABY4CKL1_9BACL|nr:hypothetical protein LSG31_19360 [Alicyclobacillaceae bacterium MYW30-H2]